MADVTLEIAPRERRLTFENLFQIYTHDFSEFWHDRTEGELDEDGLFGDYPYLDSYWQEPDRTPILIRADGHLGGFALINSFAHSGLPTDYSVAEFFVVRKHRRAGVGHAAATAIIRERPGQWEIAVVRRNAAAQTFWRRVAASVAGDAVEALDRDDSLWNGLILRFGV
jgi:predicted acetyltransferase